MCSVAKTRARVERAPCLRCGTVLVLEEPRVSMWFSPAELAQLAIDTTNPKVRDRALCAMGMIDHALELRTRAELANDAPGCPSCVELLAEIKHLEKASGRMARDLADVERDLEDARR